MLPDVHPVEVNPTLEKEALESWQDPNPAPVIELIEGIHVVRDDLLTAGSKARGLDYLIGHSPAHRDVEVWVYGSSPAHGYAQISLPVVCQKYGKKAVIFMADRDKSKLHRCQLKGLELGGDYRWVPNGMLSVTQKRASDYVAESPHTRSLLPLGGSHASMVYCLAKVARALPIIPDYVWSICSSGTLSRSLQAAWPSAEVHAVTVGHKPTEDERGRAILHPSRLAFNKECPVAERPPFPSVPEYDAKCWSILKIWRNDNPNGSVLLWNVGA